jgi:hypothetical protein
MVDIMMELDLPRAIAAWLGSTKHSRIYISKNPAQNCHELTITRNTGYDYKFGVIGDTWVVVPPGVELEIADPKFFDKLEVAIQDIESTL